MPSLLTHSFYTHSLYTHSSTHIPSTHIPSTHIPSTHSFYTHSLYTYSLHTHSLYTHSHYTHSLYTHSLYTHQKTESNIKHIKYDLPWSDFIKSRNINLHLLFLMSKQAMRNESKPATATGFIICRSQWYGHRVNVPLPRWVRPCAMRIQKRLLGSFAWYTASWRNIVANLALFVPGNNKFNGLCNGATNRTIHRICIHAMISAIQFILKG